MIQEKEEEDVSAFLGKEAYAGETALSQTLNLSASATTLAPFSIFLISSGPYIGIVLSWRTTIIFTLHYIFYPGDRLIRAF
jgi:hypothetical protein